MQCTGRGTCNCGICSCEAGFFGQACECDEGQCNEDSGLLCSGRGTCGCDGRCTGNVEPVSQCPYEGNFCECTPNTQNCRDPTNRTVSELSGSVFGKGCMTTKATYTVLIITFVIQ